MFDPVGLLPGADSVLGIRMVLNGLQASNALSMSYMMFVVPPHVEEGDGLENLPLSAPNCFPELSQAM